MRILVEQSGSQMGNLGDIAMLQVAVERLRALWPSGTISVITRSPTPLSEFVQGVSDVLIEYPSSWLTLRRIVSDRLLPRDHLLPARMEVLLSRLFTRAYHQTLAKAIEDHDLVMHSGAGVLADPFVPAAIRRLSLFERAIRAGKPTALLGQGIGPLNTPELKRAVRHVLSQANLVSLRDPISARFLTDELGITQREFPVTGDDALELASRARRDHRGNRIGFNLRLASYSGIAEHDAAALDPLAGALKTCSGEPGRAILPLAVHKSDAESARDWLGMSGIGNLAPEHEMTVSGLLEAISQCRLVVTASYHGAVLALGQGIPALCYFRTEYYRRKFLGLAELFSGGCRLLDLSRPVDADEVIRLIEQLCGRDDELQRFLLRAGQEQVESARRVYERLPKLVEGN